MYTYEREERLRILIVFQQTREEEEEEEEEGDVCAVCGRVCVRG